MNKGLGLIISVGKPKTMNDQNDMMDSQSDSEMNQICLGKDAYPNASDGDEVETKAKGKIVIKDDGTKYLVVESTDGVPVEGSEQEEASESPEEEASEDESTDKPDSSMRADEALDQFMKSKQNEE